MRSLRRHIALLVTVLLVAGATAATASTSTAPSGWCDTASGGPSFHDVEANVHRDSIDCLAGHGIAEGHGDGTFRPRASVTRGQVASFLHRLLEVHGVAPSPTDTGFTDVGSGHAHGRAIGALASVGVINGIEASWFAPDRAVTRGQLASMVARTHRSVFGDGLPRAAAPADVRGSVHEAGVRQVVGAEVATGYQDGTFRPDEPVSRQQMATFLARFGEIVAATHGGTRPTPSPRPSPSPSPTPSPSPSPGPGAEPVGEVSCDVVVPVSQRVVDDAGPGDVVCLEPGVRGQLRLFGLQGTADEPVVVVNDGGVVDIRASGAYAGIEMRDSAHVRVSGTGVEARCGARFTEDEQACGIRVSESGNGVTGRVRTEYTTVDHVEVGHVESAGLLFHDREAARGSWVQRDVAFLDLYVHDIETEGHYHGASKYTGGERHLLDGVQVVRNLVVRTGRDGIQVGSAPWNCEIRDNVVADTGLSGEDSHSFGIIINRGSACDVIGNQVSSTPRSGIYDQGLHGQTIAGNEVVDSGEYGITVREGNQAPDNPETPDYPRSTHILDNRVEGAGSDGIRLGNPVGTDNRIEGNTLSGIDGDPIRLSSGATASVEDNSTD